MGAIIIAGDSSIKLLGIGEVLVFYLPIYFLYYLAKLVIFIRSSRILEFSFEGGFKGTYLRKKFYPFVCGFRDMNF